MKNIIYIVCTLVLMVSCSSDPLKVDVSDKKVDIPLLRMEKDFRLSVADESEAKSMNDSLLSKYGVIYERFVHDFLQEGNAHDPMVGAYLKRRIDQDEMLKLIFKEADGQFGDFSVYQKEINEAFKYYQHYFPDSALPENLITFVSYFNSRGEVADNNLCISLDMHMGAKSESVLGLSPAYGFPEYFKAKMEPEYLVSNSIKAWLLINHYLDTGDEVLDAMVAAGKIMYLMDAMFPEMDDRLKITWTKEELDWAKSNENKVWLTLVEQDVFYTKDDLVFKNWIDPAPFTKGLPEDSPGQMGVWVGWQMVKDYMKANEGVTLQEMLLESNPKKILKHYDPKN